MESWVKIRSYGGANTVTGSAHEIVATIDNYDYCYLVDCGLFQGAFVKKHPEMNFNLREVAKDINAVFVTHAHIDHIGRLPALHRWGFYGPIYATYPVCEIAEPMLEDCAHIQLEEYLYNSEKELIKKQKGEEYKEIELLYELEDAEDVVEQFNPVETNQEIVINEHLTVVFYDAGHGLGSASIKMIFNNGEETFTLLFSGDLGNINNPILKEVENPYILGVDAVYCETTYAGRFHSSLTENWREIRELIAETLLNGGKVLLPAFAFGRTQELLYLFFYDMFVMDDDISKIFKEHTINVDSPLAIELTKIFQHFPDEFKPQVKEFMSQQRKSPFNFPNLRFIQEKEESIALQCSDEPSITIAAAGMCEAGRVRFHLQSILEREDCLVVFTGYQAEGTLGRRILDGYDLVNISKRPCHIKAKIVELNTLSSHADQNGIIGWLNNIEPGYMLFLTHGERENQDQFRELLERFGLFSSVECISTNAEYELSNYGFNKFEDEELVALKSKKAVSLNKGQIKYMLRLNEQLEEMKYEERLKPIRSKIKKEIKDLKSKIRKQSIERERKRMKLKSRKQLAN